MVVALKLFLPIVMKNFLVKTIRVSTLASLPAVLFTVAIPNRPAIAVDFGGCANSLISGGVSQEQAASACSDALEPLELSACVGDIQTGTGIEAEDALQACYRVRRPEDLASCVVDISGNLGQAEPTVALDNCRRSLLPKRYADCTLGLQSAIPDLSSTEAMETCITAEFFPGEVSPSSEK